MKPRVERCPLSCAAGAMTLALALLSGLAVAAAGPLTRRGLMGFRGAFSLMRWGAYGGAAAAALAAARLLVGRWSTLAALALAAGAAAFTVPWELLQSARRYPPIHDITTDTADPPAFVDVLPRRQGAMDPAAYGGPAVASQQEAAYPDLKPLLSPLPPPVVFTAALDTARALGWSIDGTDGAAGRVEATDTTPWFGFKDDVVVRVAPGPGGAGARVDVRSVSRVGVGDAGENARRVRRFLAALNAQLRTY